MSTVQFVYDVIVVTETFSAKINYMCVNLQHFYVCINHEESYHYSVLYIQVSTPESHLCIYVLQLCMYVLETS